MVTEEDLIRTVATAYSHGWRQVKLYFMVRPARPRPTRTCSQIADLAKKVIAKGREVSGRNDIRCTVSIGGFVPKPHTPFQWAAQLDHETTDARLQEAARHGPRRQEVRPRDRLPLPRRQARHHRGTALPRRPPGRRGHRAGVARRRPLRRLERALLLRPLGRGRRDAALAGTGVDLDWYTTREREYDEVLPWDHLDSGLDKDWLWADWEDALASPTAAPTSRSRTAAGRPATTAASARRWTPRSRSAPPAGSCSRSPSSDAARPVSGRRRPQLVLDVRAAARRTPRARTAAAPAPAAARAARSSRRWRRAARRPRTGRPRRSGSRSTG